MARTRVVRFGPGSMEAIGLHMWQQRRSGAIVAEIRGAYSVACGAGWEHTVGDITAREVGYRAEHHIPESVEIVTAFVDDDYDTAERLARRLLDDWLDEHWSDPCAEED